MVRCFGNGKCIHKRKYGYYKPYKCAYNCKLLACFYCKKVFLPQWILENNNGRCHTCVKIRHNERMMEKVFKNNTVLSY